MGVNGLILDISLEVIVCVVELNMALMDYNLLVSSFFERVKEKNF